MTYFFSFLAIFLDSIRIINNKHELAEATAPITAIILSPVNGLSQLILIKLKVVIIYNIVFIILYIMSVDIIITTINSYHDTCIDKYLDMSCNIIVVGGDGGGQTSVGHGAGAGLVRVRVRSARPPGRSARRCT